MEIKKDTVVKIHYTLTNDAGEVLDSSEGREPLALIQGAGQIIPGLENALLGKKTGDKFNVAVEPKDAYGEHDAEAVRELPRNMFAGIENLEVGMRLQAETEHGPILLKVTNVKGEMVTVDSNHELAGVTLHFDLTVDTVREATAEEIDHGHVH